jgi:tetratricopeptide (TPR) repeat protein
LEVEPDKPEVWHSRGLAYHSLGDQQQAMEDYSRALELNPGFTQALTDRGNLYLDLEQYEQALADFDAALARAELPEAYLGRGNAYQALGRLEEALAAYQRALELLPTYADAYLHISRLYLEQEDYQRAYDAADQALTLGLSGGNVSEALQLRGRAAYGLGNYTQTIADLTRVIDINPAPTGYYYRGLAYQANGQREEAISDLEFFLAQGGAEDQALIDDATARLAELRG